MCLTFPRAAPDSNLNFKTQLTKTSIYGFSLHEPRTSLFYLLRLPLKAEENEANSQTQKGQTRGDNSSDN